MTASCTNPVWLPKWRKGKKKLFFSRDTDTWLETKVERLKLMTHRAVNAGAAQHVLCFEHTYFLFYPPTKIFPTFVSHSETGLILR